jgi:E3 SUMO-protein ligase PIAS1
MGKFDLAGPLCLLLTCLRFRYFESILAACPDSVEEVIIEPDGEWHSEDNKYASPGWRSQQKEEADAKAKTSAEDQSGSARREGTTSNGNASVKREASTTTDTQANSMRVQDIVSLDDSDDDDEPPLRHVTRPAIRRISSVDTSGNNSVDRLLDDALYPPPRNGAGASDKSSTSAPPAGTNAAAAAEPVIDLTLTDDEDEPSGPVLPAWAADIPALAKADKRERSMSSMMEAEDRLALRRRLDGATESPGM